MGAGVIVSFVLMNVARVNPREVVGVTIVYELRLSALGFLNYVSVGIVDYVLATLLIAGTIPGIYLGTRMNSKASKEKLKRIINVIIIIIEIITLIQSF
ncbi:MAG: uncharacterized protein PWP39_1612 [Pyrococcus sp.]|nr:uncharacterized protein [Pyrococcus sp.]